MEGEVIEIKHLKWAGNTYKAFFLFLSFIIYVNNYTDGTHEQIRIVN